jgi:hypothetical protein
MAKKDFVQVNVQKYEFFANTLFHNPERFNLVDKNYLIGRAMKEIALAK